MQSSFTTFQHITEVPLKHTILNSPLKISRADCIPTWLLVACLDTLVTPLTRLINLSLTTRTFPTNAKVAYVTPLLKKPGLDKTIYANFRPISNLSFISKVLERVVLEQLKRHPDSELALNPLQSAYRRHYFTETALNKITSDILSEMNCQRLIVLALLDLSAAFDTIEHQTLIDRLMLNYKISSVALN